jgi:drug/metabolite transporter (DMT)-like permease
VPGTRRPHDTPPSGPAPPPGSAPLSAGTVAFVVLLCALWGGNVVAMKAGLRGVPPLASGAFRFLLASLTLLVVAWLRRTPLSIPPGLAPHLLALGGLFLFQHAVLFLGLNLTSASRSTVLIFTQPVFTVLLAHSLVPGEALSPRRAAGTLVAFAGLLVVFGEGFGRGGWQTVTGDLLVTGNAVGWALQSIYTKRLIHRADPLLLTLSQTVLGAPCFFLASWLLEPALYTVIDSGIVLAFLYHGSLIAGITWVAWTELLRRHQVGHLSAFIFLTPIFGLSLSRLILGDPLTAPLVLGLAVVAGGIALINRPPSAGGLGKCKVQTDNGQVKS